MMIFNQIYNALQLTRYVEPNEYEDNFICDECTFPEFGITSIVLLAILLIGWFLRKRNFNKASLVGNFITLCVIVYILFINKFPILETVAMMFGLFLFFGMITIIGYFSFILITSLAKKLFLKLK